MAVAREIVEQILYNRVIVVVCTVSQLVLSASALSTVVNDFNLRCSYHGSYLVGRE